MSRGCRFGIIQVDKIFRVIYLNYRIYKTPACFLAPRYSGSILHGVIRSGQRILHTLPPEHQ